MLNTSLSTTHIIGFSSSYKCELRAQLLAKATVLIGSKDMLTKVYSIYGPLLNVQHKYPINPVKNIFSILESNSNEDTIICASGDPMFFGIGKYIVNKLGASKIAILPDISFMQLAFARVGLSWNDAKIQSVHGRNLDTIDSLLTNYKKIGLYTDKKSNPTKIAIRILNLFSQKLCENIHFFVHERIGLADEELFTGTLEQASRMKFREPNFVILYQKNFDVNCTSSKRFGYTEKEIAHLRGLITKDEIRAISLHKLQPKDRSVFWDVGAGSGSIGIEYCKITQNSQIFSIEKNSDNQSVILSNKETFCLNNLNLIRGSAPELLHELPSPDRVFIGGSGGRLEDIINISYMKLNPGGLIVINCVLMSSKAIALEVLGEMCGDVEVIETSINRSKLTSTASIRLNTITTVVGKKK